jgi:hypothetical protein
VEHVIDVAVRSWMLEQLVVVEHHQPEMVDQALSGSSLRANPWGWA